MTTRSTFEPTDGSWSEYAALDGLRSVLDPRDQSGAKNRSIDETHRAAIRELIQVDDRSTVLDFGCGTGRVTRELGARVRLAVGVDITAEMLVRARRETPSARVAFCRIDGVALPIATGACDAVVSVYVLQYFVRTPEVYGQVLAEMHRLLRPGGRCYFVEQVSFSNGSSGSVGETSRVEDYLGPARRGDFDVVRSYAIRPGSPGRIERRLLASGVLPAPLRTRLLHRSRLRARLLTPVELARQPYVDWLFELVRRA